MIPETIDQDTLIKLEEAGDLISKDVARLINEIQTFLEKANASTIEHLQVQNFAQERLGTEIKIATDRLIDLISSADVLVLDLEDLSGLANQIKAVKESLNIIEAKCK